MRFARVLSPSGVTVHVFPSKWRLFESHFYTPFGGVINSPLWCTLWAWRKKPGRKDFGLLEYGRLASRTIRSETNYLPRAVVMRYFGEQFSVVKSCAAEYGTALIGRHIAGFLEVPLSELHVRVLICQP